MKTAADAFIDGRWVPGSSRFVVRDPYDDALVAEVTNCGDAEIDAAIDAATRAFATWRAKPGPDRGKLVS